MNKIINYFKEIFSEFRKITWPTKEKLAKLTTVVMLTILISAAVLAAIDFGLNYAYKEFITVIEPYRIKVLEPVANAKSNPNSTSTGVVTGSGNSASGTTASGTLDRNAFSEPQKVNTRNEFTK